MRNSSRSFLFQYNYYVLGRIIYLVSKFCFTVLNVIVSYKNYTIHLLFFINVIIKLREKVNKTFTSFALIISFIRKLENDMPMVVHFFSSVPDIVFFQKIFECYNIHLLIAFMFVFPVVWVILFCFLVSLNFYLFWVFCLFVCSSL